MGQAQYRGQRYNSEDDSISVRGRPRCDAYAKTAGRRCSNSAVIGLTKCKWHCGKRSVRNTLRKNELRYRGHLGKRLTHLVETGLNRPSEQVLDLKDELEVMRGMLTQTLDHLKICEDKIDSHSLEIEKRMEIEGLQVSARSAVMGQIEMVGNMVERLVRVETRQSQAVSVNAIGTVVVQIVNAVTEEVKDEGTLTKILERLHQLRIPVGFESAVKVGGKVDKSGSNGTQLLAE